MSEVGIIGQIYEDRRTHKKGKLLERDEKYKTLLMESDDGKSFNITYGGFKSNWRKVDEEVPTIEEAMQEVEVPVIASEKPVIEAVPKVKKQRKEHEVSKGFETATLKLLEYVKSFNNKDITSKVTPEKRRIAVKCRSKRAFVVAHLVRFGKYQVCVAEDFFVKLKDKNYVTDSKFNETWQTSLRYSFVMEEECLDTFFEDARQYIIEDLCKEEDK